MGTVSRLRPHPTPDEIEHSRKYWEGRRDMAQQLERDAERPKKPSRAERFGWVAAAIGLVGVLWFVNVALTVPVR